MMITICYKSYRFQLLDFLILISLKYYFVGEYNNIVLGSALIT